jgi:hypothetical protein
MESACKTQGAAIRLLLFMAKFFRGDKRRREMDRKRRTEEKQRRVQMRRELRAKGLDPDLYDADGNLRPIEPGAAGPSGPAADEDTDDDADEVESGES